MKIYVFAVLFAFCSMIFAQSIEEELKLLGGEDFIINENKTVQSNNNVETEQSASDTNASDTMQIASDSTQTEDVSAETTQNNSNQQADNAAVASPMPVGRRGGPSVDTSTAPKISVFDTAGVADERSIDFSRNLTEYRQPQRALFYSLLLPGLGQAYNKDYWRTGLYAAIEVGMITGAIYFKQDAKKIRKKAENYADDHFDSEKLEKFYVDLTNAGRQKYPKDSENSDTNTLNYLIFGEYSGFVDDTVNSAIDKYKDQLNSDFYSKNGVGSRRFAVQGWDDAKPTSVLDISSEIFTGKDSIDLLTILGKGETVFGTSDHQNHFISLLDDSREQSRKGSVFIVGIFVNHIASAADAFISAIIHNRRLLKEESGESTKTEEVLSRISIESDMYFDYKNDLTTKLGFVWRF